ncbi:uncharacterized protein LOC116617256 [Nematostella vectensis]|uniref:uncharacterized protein LOC116617256 n=1 Tax=Nematostella vectensis TaxID=45351 RepID=UPI002077172A|nr:uncharacterized protein LOC116617256 [Nematostella vectensis]
MANVNGSCVGDVDAESKDRVKNPENREQDVPIQKGKGWGRVRYLERELKRSQAAIENYLKVLRDKEKRLHDEEHEHRLLEYHLHTKEKLIQEQGKELRELLRLVTAQKKLLEDKDVKIDRMRKQIERLKSSSWGRFKSRFRSLLHL